jgi:pimeloyl-ACP methyl ester carboxylesterase
VRSLSFRHNGHRLAYSDYGVGAQTLVLLSGLLISRRMHDPLARALTDRGVRVITLDYLGHGDSDKPGDPGQYSAPVFADQVVALLDHAGIGKCVVGGTSLGANVTLEVAVIAPQRLHGIVVEMPVLDNALTAAVMAFAPLTVGLDLGEPLARVVANALRQVPRRGLPFYAGLGLDVLSQDPAASVAVLKGLFFGRVAPPQHERVRIKTQTLVIGHHRDPVHPFADAGMLLDELPNARLVEASHILEMRISPDRMAGEIAKFVQECSKGSRAKSVAKR